MSNRSKKAQFSRSLKKKSIHIGGKSEKVTPPPLKKPTSVLDNCSPEEIRNLKERLAQREELNVLFFHLKQMADFLEADINQFNSDLHLTNKKLSISEKIISPQEHLICERLARKIVGSTYNNTTGFYDLNYIKTAHNIISSSKKNLVEFYEDKSNIIKRMLLDNSYDSYNYTGNVVYNNWAASLLPILQIQHYMALKELGSLKQYEPCVVSDLFTSNDFSHALPSILIHRGEVVVNSFNITCQFSFALDELLLRKDLTDKVTNLAQNLELITKKDETSDSDNVAFLSELLDAFRNLTGTTTPDRKKILDLSVGLAPSPDIYISFDDCFDTNCSIIDIDKELSQLDLSKDPSLEASLRKVYCDFNELLQQQSIAQKQVTTTDFYISELDALHALPLESKRLFFINKKYLFLAQTEILASATKPVEYFYSDSQQNNNNLLQQEDDVKQAFVLLNNIINDDDTPPDSFSADVQAVQEYQLRCMALFSKERSFYANLDALMSANVHKQISDCVKTLQQTEFKESTAGFFHQYISSLLVQEKAIHSSNMRILSEILDNLDNLDNLIKFDNQVYQDLNHISDINQAANTANLFKVITRFLHCFITDDYEFARFIVDAYNKPSLQFELDKLLNEAQLALTSQIEQLKGKNQAIAVQAGNLADNADGAPIKVWPAGSLAANEPSELTPTTDKGAVQPDVPTTKSGEPQIPEQHSSDTQTTTKGDTESEAAKAKPIKAKAVKAKAKTKAATAKASTKDDSVAAQKSSVSAADATALSPSEQGITLLNAQERKSLMAALAAQNPNPKSELNYSNPFELLCAVVLSAQATDASVNLVTPELFAAAPTPEKMAALGEEAIGNLIKRVGLWRNKAKNLAQLAAILHEEYNDQVPDSFEELIKLPGVGAKTARVVLNVAFGQPYIAVDTHVFRVCNRTGLCLGNTAEKVAKHLPDLIDPEFLMNAHHYLLLHGRYVCTAKNFEERCATCVAAPWCKHNYPKD